MTGIPARGPQRLRVASLALACAVLAACQPGAPDVSRGAATYAEYCAGCHGPRGRGDGLVAARLPQAPPDLTTLAAANGGSFPRDRVIETIHGYPGKYHNSLMPEFGPALSGPTMTLRTEDGALIETSRSLVELVAFLQSLQGGTP